MKYKLLKQFNVSNKRVFLRTDFNVPIVNKKILDDSKIKAHHTTIDYLAGKGARIIVGTHIGRPNLQETCSRKDLIHNNPDTDAGIIFRNLKKVYGDKISFIDSGIGKVVNTRINNLPRGHILLLQNLRYEKGEQSGVEKEKLEFAKQLSSCIDIYVNDALSVCQNRDTSVSYLPRLSKKKAIGFLLQEEVDRMEKLIKPELPAAAFLGGFKVKDKIGVFQKLLGKGFEIFIGGAMRNPFLKLQNYNIGGSKLDSDYDDILHQMMSDFGDQIHIPVDVRAGRITGKDKRKVTNLKYVNFLKNEKIHAREEALDNGPATMKLYSKIIKQKGIKTILANGPFGLIENRSFRFGTFQVARIFLENQQAFRVYGGGELSHGFNLFSRRFKIETEKLGEQCNAGNGMLQYIANDGDLPGLRALTEKKI
ncbi:MAG: phosphoglycerate kinase [Candidatus Brocadiaceae bacterium]|nr:phosphoglycerate kinase [Candidatus Brocadiaceae bacterium]